MVRPRGLVDIAIQNLLPLATASALVAAAALVLPLTIGSTTLEPDAETPADPALEVVAAADATQQPGVALVGDTIEEPISVPVPAADSAQVARPSHAAVSPRTSAELPIIMYHHVGNLPSNPDSIRRDLTVSPTIFEKQLQHFREHGIHAVHLYDVFDHLAGRSTLPAKAVVLTFDDGYDDNFEFAYPLLEQYGMVGTFFITTGFVDRPGYMTWGQLKQMSAAGMSIQAHSVDHSDFTAVTTSNLKRQLLEPKQVLEEALGKPVRFVAYPAGKFNRAVIQATAAAGYQAAVTVNHGTKHTTEGPFELPRVRARGGDTVDQLVARMTPASWRNIGRQ